MTRQRPEGRNRSNRPPHYTGIVLKEVLSKPDESEKPLNEQEYWTLAIVDFTESYRRGFIVEQKRVLWRESVKEFWNDQIETERWPLLIDAEERYEARRLALVKKGFVHSDMDF
jgi:hypothetical protein